MTASSIPEAPFTVERTPSSGLIRVTAKSLIFSNGLIVEIASLKPEECEQLAIELRAEAGVVPYGLWVALTDKGRGKLSGMTMVMARWIRAHGNIQPHGGKI